MTELLLTIALFTCISYLIFSLLNGRSAKSKERKWKREIEKKTDRSESTLEDVLKDLQTKNLSIRKKEPKYDISDIDFTKTKELWEKHNIDPDRLDPKLKAFILAGLFFPFLSMYINRKK